MHVIVKFIPLVMHLPQKTSHIVQIGSCKELVKMALLQAILKLTSDILVCNAFIDKVSFYFNASFTAKDAFSFFPRLPGYRPSTYLTS